MSWRSFLLPRRCSSNTSHRPFSPRISISDPPSALDRLPLHVFRSTSTDPHLNLSIEHYLLTHSHPLSRILFLYTNRPCIVIGRNQNPWVECNLPVLRRGSSPGPTQDVSLASGTVEEPPEILLVRRRSGGGTVFHDDGNLNYSIIVPNPSPGLCSQSNNGPQSIPVFKRATHAELVVRGLTRLLHSRAAALHLDPKELPRVSVNARNDIVLLPPPSSTDPFASTRKISGSAFKLTRGRALHHGTLLFASPFLDHISKLLHSPARDNISARGAESVRSKVANLFPVFAGTDAREARRDVRGWIEAEIILEFLATYHSASSDAEVVELGDDLLNPSSSTVIQEIVSGVSELCSPAWTFAQTPQFLFSTHPVKGLGGDTTFTPSRPPFSRYGLPGTTRVYLRAKNGALHDVEFSLSSSPAEAARETQQAQHTLLGKNLHEITNWNDIFRRLDAWTHPSTGALTRWLSEMFPPVALSNAPCPESEC